MKYEFGFIGTGNMGGAIARAVSKATDSVILADHFADKAQALAQELGVSCGDNNAVAKSAKYIFLGVKPQMMADMLGSIKDVLAQRTDASVLVTMAAGLSIASIRSFAGGDYKVIRIMPNTPVAVGEGEVLYAPAENVTDEELQAFLNGMRFAGALTKLNESLMDAGCSLSGCGPAFVYKFIRALAQGGEDCGLAKGDALALAAQTVIGSAKLLSASDEDPAVLIERVCSPGGSTIEGVRSLDADSMEDTVRRAIAASYKRNIELGKS